MKKIVFTLALVVSVLMAPAQVRIDGRALIHDSLTGRYLCTLPEAAFGSPLRAWATLDPGTQWSGVELDGQSIDEAGAYIDIDPLDGTTPHTLTATVDGTAMQATLLFSFLPLLEVNAPLSVDYQHGTFMLHHPDSTSAMPLQGRIKWRGVTTLMENRHKRNFHIKLEDEHGEKQNRKLLGLRDDNSWMLDAGQVDLSRVRNHVAHELWLDMAAKPYYILREPKARSAVRGQLIELFVNGQYEGIYALSEAMDRKQMRLAKYETDSEGNHTIHGQLWKSVVYHKTTTFSSVDEYDNLSPTWGGFETKYPELDEVSPTDYSVLYNAVNFAATAYDSNWRKHARDHYDLPVLRDYMIFLHVMLAIDNAGKNHYWAVYDREVDKKLTLAVWDLDCTVGQDWTNTPFRPEERVGPERSWRISSNLYGRLYLLIDDFHQGVIDRYWKLRKGVLGTDSLTRRYLSHIDMLIEAGAAARESTRWSGDSDLGGRELDWEAEKAYIADWIARRLHHLDVTTFATSGVEALTDATPPTHTGTYDLMGRKMPDDRPLPPGIYVRDGQKIVVH